MSSGNPSVSVNSMQYPFKYLIKYISAVNLIKGSHHTPMSPFVKKERMFDLFMEALFILRSVVIPVYMTGSLSVLFYFVSDIFFRFLSNEIYSQSNVFRPFHCLWLVEATCHSSLSLATTLRVHKLLQTQQGQATRAARRIASSTNKYT